MKATCVRVEGEVDVGQLMRQSGIDEHTVVRIIKDGLEAEKKGEPDHSVRLRYLDLAMKMLGIDLSTGEDEDVRFLNKQYSRLTDEQLQEEFDRRIEILRSAHS